MAVLTAEQIIELLNNQQDTTTIENFYSEDERGVDLLMPASTVTIVDGTDNNDFKVLVKLVDSQGSSMVVHATTADFYFMIEEEFSLYNGKRNITAHEIDDVLTETVGTTTVRSFRNGDKTSLSVIDG